ncbi:MAG: nitrogenase iron protein NifH [Oliverpabstia sp.]
MRRIAFYGKGGIGKSTIAANISSVCAMQGKKVLHIGCDPKADSTRVLTNSRVPTVLEQLELLNRELTEKDILFTGKHGVCCVEAGGPQAGMGCAGLGITSAVNELERMEILSRPWDMIVYDVLGDVVCGGFSVPMRKHYADRIYIVTSADYMSLYAANNILKGCRHYSGKGKNLAAGLILNHIKNEQEMMIGNKFSQYTGLPVAAFLRESREMQNADYQNALFTELFPDSVNSREIHCLLKKMMEDDITQNQESMLRKEQEIHPLDENQLERFRKEIWNYVR